MPIENLFIKKSLLIARGIIEISPEILFVLIANTTKFCISLSEKNKVCQLTKWNSKDQKLMATAIEEGAEEPAPAKCILHESQFERFLKKNLLNQSQTWISNGPGCQRRNQKKYVNYYYRIYLPPPLLNKVVKLLLLYYPVIYENVLCLM